MSSFWGPSVRMKISPPQQQTGTSNWTSFFQSKSGVTEAVPSQSRKHEQPKSEEENDEDSHLTKKRR